jgi:curli production assembly/transport component CsgF
MTAATTTSRTLAIALGLLCAYASASELVYQPVNPSFGGHPANGPGLLATATATSKHTARDPLGSMFDSSPLAQFNQSLERTVLSQLASAATSKLTGPDGRLLPGTFSTENFIITVVDVGGGVLRITTTDKKTGATTSFEVSQ